MSKGSPFNNICKCCLLIFFICNSELIHGQTGIDDVIPPSPTASSLGKYGEIPVSNYTGTANISIPLYSLPARDFNVPISLSYHTSGVKIEELASWVGMGWSLNAGGVITRSVVGLPDEGQGGFFTLLNEGGIPYESYDYPSEHTVSTVNNPNEFQKISEMIANLRDTSPDVYYYNINGQSGKLIFDENGDFHTSPHTNIKIVKKLAVGNSDEWILIDPNGIQYVFGSSDGTGNGIETTGINGEVTPPETAWYLTKITTPKNEEITFDYDLKSIPHLSSGDQTFTWYHPNQSTALEVLLGGQNDLPASSAGVMSSRTPSSRFYSGLSILRTIQSSYGSVEFQVSDERDDFAGVKLTNVIIKNAKSELIKSYALNYHYEEHHHERLYLSSVTEFGQGNQSLPPYTFEYVDTDVNGLAATLPSRESLAQDNWGYYNGASNNQHLIGRSHSFSGITFPSNFQFADRQSNELYMQVGALNKIHYPTGGHTTLTYEANKAKIEGSFVQDPTVINLASSRGELVTELFELEFQQQVSFDLSFVGYREIDNFYRPFVKLEKLDGASWVEEHRWRPDYPALDDEYVYTNLDLLVSEYRLTIDTEDCADPLGNCQTPPGNPDDLYTVEVDLSYYEGSAGGYLNQVKPVGGLRVAQVDNSLDAGSVNSTNIRNYTYDPGILVSTPVYAYSYDQEYCINSYMNPVEQKLMCDTYAFENVYKVYSSSYANLGTSQGSHVVYPVVTMSQGPNSENGYITYQYSTNGLAQGGIYDYEATTPPFAPKDIEEYLSGLLQQESIYDTDGNKISESVNQYSNGSTITNYHATKGFKMLKSVEYSIWGNQEHSGGRINNVRNFYYDQYRNQSKWVFLESTKNRIFDQVNREDYVESVMNYEYDPTHLNPTRTIAMNSIGRARITENYYPTDYSLVNSGLIHDLKTSDHQHNRIIESLVKKGIATYDAATQEYLIDDEVVLGGQYFKYIKSNGIITLDKVYQLDTGTGIEDDGADPLQYSVVDPDGDFDSEYFNSQPESDLDFDQNGNLIEHVNRSGIRSSIIWSYNHLYPIAQIQNATIADIQSAVSSLGPTFLTDLSATVVDSEVLEGLEQLRTELRINLPSALMTSYTHRAGIGVASITDTNGFTTYYQYDSFGRLVGVKDDDLYLLKQFEYNFRQQN